MEAAEDEVSVDRRFESTPGDWPFVAASLVRLELSPIRSLRWCAQHLRVVVIQVEFFLGNMFPLLLEGLLGLLLDQFHLSQDGPECPCTRWIRPNR